MFADADEAWVDFFGTGNWWRGLHSPDSRPCLSRWQGRLSQTSGGGGVVMAWSVDP